MAKNRFSAEDQQLLVDTAGRLPPITICLESKTPEQSEKINLIREHFLDIRAALQAFFSGKSNPVGLIDPIRRRLIEGELRYYLAAYNLFFFGWQEIQAKAALKLSKEDQAVFPNSPGEALALILEGDCDSMCRIVNEDLNVNVRESKSILQSGLPNLSEYSGLNLKRAQRTVQYSEDIGNRVSLSAHLIVFCQDAVRKRLRGNLALKKELREFEAMQKRRFSEQRKMLAGVRGW